MPKDPNTPKTDPEQIIHDLEQIIRALVIAGDRARVCQNHFESLRTRLEPFSQHLRERRTFKNHAAAFDEARKIVLKNLETDKTLTIKVLAIAASYSWPFWTSMLPDILEDESQASCKLDVLLVHPDFLSQTKAGTNKAGKTWEVMSRDREDAAREVLREMDPKLRARYKLTLSYYRNLPHTHGVLINGSSLILGRCTWEQNSRKVLNLRAGENTYRTYFIDSDPGAANISAFEGWFDYYSKQGTSCNLSVSE